MNHSIKDPTEALAGLVGGPSASLSISKNKLPVRVEFEGGLVKYGFVFLRNN